LKEIKSIQD